MWSFALRDMGVNVSWGKCAQRVPSVPLAGDDGRGKSACVAEKNGEGDSGGGGCEGQRRHWDWEQRAAENKVLGKKKIMIV